VAQTINHQPQTPNHRSPITNRKSFPLVISVLLCSALCLAYLPDLGHGFIRDDFRWIREARVHSATDAAALLTQNVGFYRPAVSATFALNYALAGTVPFAYGATNFFLLVTGAALLFFVARRLGLPTAACAVASALWVFNFHGINMALLWISGRTTLLLSCASLASALFVLNGRVVLGALFCLVALLSKEEAVVLPFLLACWVYPNRHPSTVWPLFAALVVYLVLRLQSGAFWPSTAPSYYRLTLDSSLLVRNVLEYLDRGATWSAVVALIVMAAARTRPSFNPEERRVLALGALWFACGYAITVFVPGRSSLYAVFPSIGVCLATATLVGALIRRQPDRTLRTLAALSVIPLLLVPVYRARNARWVGPAELSAAVLSEVRREAGTFPSGARIVLIDDPLARPNLDTAFGGLLPDAIALTLGERFRGEVLPDAGDAANTPLDGALVLTFRHGRLDPSGPRGQ
jgi:hypothetical protein